MRQQGKGKRRIRHFALIGDLLLIAALFISSTMSSVLAEPEPTSSSTNGTRQTGSHTVFAEYFTTGWCQYCPSASANLKSVYESNDYNFYFVSMIIEDGDSNQISQDARDRANEFGISGYPTVEFDGGYIEVVGGQSDDTNYRSAISTCNDREYANVDLELTAEHRGGAKIGISVEVTNNEDSSYSGTLRVYIVEIISRYLNYDGNHSTFGFLDFAINADVEVLSGQTETEAATWDGASVSDDLGNDFGDIQPDNIIIFATISNGNRATALDRHPQSSMVLNLYFIDDATAAHLTTGSLDDTQPPNVDIITPIENQVLSELIRINAYIQDDGTIFSVEFQIDDTNIWTRMFPEGSVENEYFAFWDTEFVEDGDHTITVRAIDLGNNEGQDYVMVMVANYMDDDVKPVIEFDDLDDNQEVMGSVPFTVVVIDESDIKAVRYKVDEGSWQNMIKSSYNKYKGTINTTDFSDGEHTITVQAEDRAGNIQMKAITLKISNYPSNKKSTGGFLPGFEFAIIVTALLFVNLYFYTQPKKN